MIKHLVITLGYKVYRCHLDKPATVADVRANLRNVSTIEVDAFGVALVTLVGMP